MVKINKFLLYAASASLVLSMLIAVLNMVLRPFGYPILGSYELMGFGNALIISLGLGYSFEKRSHIAVDIIFRKLPKSFGYILDRLGRLASALFFCLVSWKLFMMTINFYKNGELSETLRIPFYPVTFGVALGILVLALDLFISCFSKLNKSA